MARSSDSVRASSAAFAPRRRTRWQFAAAALVLLASVGWAPRVSDRDNVQALAIDPDTPTTLYAGVDCAGVFKSLDGGDSWRAVNTGLPDHVGFQALAIDPSTPTTVYAGSTYDGAGVFRSLNGGSSWSAVNAGLERPFVYALAIDPTTPTTLYAGGLTAGVFRSLNGGSSWQATGGPDDGVTGADVRALAIDPSTPTTLYAGAYGVFRSLNGGSSWSAVRSGLPDYPIVYALAIDPTASTTLYAGMLSGGVFRSLNAGSSWSAANAGLPDNNAVFTLAIDPITPTTLYAGTQTGVFRSLNGGSSWSAVNAGLPDHPLYNVNALAIDPTASTTLYAGTVGVFKSTNGGSSWQAAGHLGCGDGAVRCDEQCDDGGESATCDTNCTLAQCGDGTLNVTAGEQCDDGNRNPFDGCTNECTVCGDGSVTSPEECDDGNTSSGDACDTQCRHLRVVGAGTPESCTETEFAAALAERSVSFNCGPAPVTIILTSEKEINAGTTIDGGGRITLSGGGAVRIFTIDVSAGLEVRNLTIADGHPDREVGSAISNAGTLSVTNSTFTGKGRAISNFGTLGVTNSTFSGNSAERGGGALLNVIGSATLTNCTLSENGGAILNFCDDPNDPDTLGVSPSPRGGLPNCYFGLVTLTNTIIAESTGPSCSGPITDGGHNLQFPDTSCGETIPSLDPLLDPAGLENNGGPTQTIALLDDSPAIDAGDPEVCANPPVNGVDQRGYVRPGSGHTQCSIGAYEANAVSPNPCVGDCGGTGSVTVDEIITLVNIALGTISMVECGSGDANHDSQVTVNEILTAVNVALSGCSLPPMPTPRFLTEDAALYDYWPCFSPDASSVLFSRTADGQQWELRIVPAAGGPSVPFSSAPLPVSATRANWSPSGDRIAFTGVSASGTNTLWLISATGADAHRVTVSGLSSSVFYPSFYPDGNRLAIMDNGAGGLNGGIVRMVDLAQATVASLTNHAEILAGKPAVSPDGERVAFAGQRNLGQVYDQTQNSIFIVEAGGAVTQPDPGQGRSPAWSPDGEWIAFESVRASSEGRYATFVMRRDGSGMRQLTDASFDATHPVFSPDGKLLAFDASKPEWSETARGIAVIDLPDP